MVLIKERVGKLLDDLKGMIYVNHLPITNYQVQKVDDFFSDPQEIDAAKWSPMTNKEIWGGNQERFYFRTTVTVTPEQAGKALVYELRTGREGEWDAVNPQFLVYVNGVIRQGLDVNHREVLLSTCAKEGDQYEILLSAFTGENNFWLHLDSETKTLLRDVEKYYYDLRVPYEVARLLPKDSDEYLCIIQALNESLNRLDLRQVHSQAFFDSLAQAQAYLDKEFYQKRCGKEAPVICCVGHTHIDVAWLWTLKTTQDKAVRSFSTVLEMMDQYPEYKFMSSQPQLYKYVKQNAPAVYEKIKERVKEGRWEPEGGMFVEADCNIASGEALVRQFLHGIRFFDQEFHRPSKILWLPDVFGYSAALPQIMKKCGIDYFMTTKISWNEFNKMPYDTFLWEGIDGTKVLTHFMPARDYGVGAKEGSAETEHFTTYNAMLNPSQIKGSWQRYSQKYLNNEVLISYGYGDGGGGPTLEMLENQRRLSRGIPGCPTTVQSHALEFFQKLEHDVMGNKYLPHWVGELYLEYHRGTYTSMARNKRWNRKMEFAFENAELYRTLACAFTGLPYPKEELREGWEVLLRNQFHDILPGSSIREVYEDSAAEYRQIEALAQEKTEQALKALVERVDGQPGDLVVFNPNGVAAPSTLTIKGYEGAAGALTDGEKSYPVQHTQDGLVAVIPPIPAKGWKTFRLTDSSWENQELYVKGHQVETPFFSVRLNQAGQFVSIYDKQSGREVIPEGKVGNLLVTYEDRPHNFDAWDINNYYTEKAWELNEPAQLDVVEEGPVRIAIKVSRTYLDSTMEQYLYFYRDLPRIDIRNEIDWREKQILMRAYYPVDVHTNEATYEIQYGNVKRPTHYNTSWDFAKFEVCAHKWLDVSEQDYGVGLMNDCKYGYSVHDGVIGCTMLKSAVYPNPDADKEHHTFWYSICPHKGGFDQAGMVAQSYLFNNPCVVVEKDNQGGTLPRTASWISVDDPNVVVEVVKQAEDSEDMIVRLYQSLNQRSQVKLMTGFDVKRAAVCTMLEQEETELAVEKNQMTLSLKPFEIVTLKLVRQ